MEIIFDYIVWTTLLLIVLITIACYLKVRKFEQPSSTRREKVGKRTGIYFDFFYENWFKGMVSTSIFLSSSYFFFKNIEIVFFNSNNSGYESWVLVFAFAGILVSSFFSLYFFLRNLCLNKKQIRKRIEISRIRIEPEKIS